jgi:subtilisin family serine protease
VAGVLKNSDGRRRTTDQVELLRKAQAGGVAWDSEAAADFTYLYHPDNVLLRLDRDTADTDFVEALGRTVELDGEANRVNEPVAGVALYSLPPRSGGQSVAELLDLLDDDETFGPGRVSPDHYLHVVPNATCCPATEPEETGVVEPWPEVRAAELGAGARVVVVDTGWHTDFGLPNSPIDWLVGVDGDPEVYDATDMAEYVGHGTFVAGVVKCLAPSAVVTVKGFAVGGVASGGGILESQIVVKLIEAMATEEKPHVINLSAGCRTRGDQGMFTFESFHEHHLKQADCVLVAAAGNDSSPAPFWPAAFDWAVGVGSLDRDGRVSSFSNYCKSADLYALGRNHINAFPDGRYVCKETPNTGGPGGGDVREFKTGRARWSGTSFAAPVVAGLIAAELAGAGTAAAATTQVKQQAQPRSDPEIGPIQALLPPY